LLRQSAEKLSCAPEELVVAASRALTERDANFKNGRALLERLAVAEAALALQSTSLGPSGLRIVSVVFDGLPAEYLGFFATELSKYEKTVALLAAVGGGDMLFAQHPSAGKDLNALLKQVLKKVDGKGGGTRDFVRGRLSEASQARNAIDLAKELLSAA
jgi:alanyl-tRNA synthetase